MTHQQSTASAIYGLNTTLIVLTLLALKVSGPLADLSWWWVFGPIWIPVLILATLAALVKK